MRHLLAPLAALLLAAPCLASGEEEAAPALQSLLAREGSCQSDGEAARRLDALRRRNPNYLCTPQIGSCRRVRGSRPDRDDEEEYREWRRRERRYEEYESLDPYEEDARLRRDPHYLCTPQIGSCVPVN